MNQADNNTSLSSFSGKTSFFQPDPWENCQNSIWLASHLKLERNLTKSLFPSKLDSMGGHQTLSSLKDDFLKCPHLNKPFVLLGDQVMPLDKEYLFEHFLSHETFKSNHSSQGFVLDSTGETLGLINMRNHLDIQLLDLKCDLDQAFSRLMAIENHLASTNSFAFNPKFGYLTADPSRSGTGLTVHIYLHLPALAHTGELYKALDEMRDESVSVSGLQGDLKELIGHVITLHNNFTLGVTEENILNSLRAYSSKLIQKEQALRAKLYQEEDPGIRDQVNRSFGLINYSYQLETPEALAALSWVKFGADTGWITGASMGRLNALFIQCRRAHMAISGTDKDAKEPLAHRRSELLREALKECVLH